MKTLTCDIAVIGGSLGGLRAALSALRRGRTVALTEETDWVGGQMTNQGVPPDEHWLIEQQGCTASYRAHREKIRAHYRALPHFKQEIKQREWFDPGSSWVSRITHEPQISMDIFREEMQPYIANGQLTLLTETKPVSAQVEGDLIHTVTVQPVNGGEGIVIAARQFLDGTDCGDLLPLVGAEYRVGAESRAQTGEPSAPKTACPQDMQPVTWVFALEMVDELRPEDRIPKPAEYDHYASITASYADNKLLSWYCIALNGGGNRILRMFSGEVSPTSRGLWEYRRIRAQENYDAKVTELSLINWPQQDYMFGNLFEDERAEHHRAQAKVFAQCLAYWIQNEADRVDGGKGYPVRLAKGVLGTEDGFAKAPYIRESRRIVARHTIREQDIALQGNPEPRVFANSVGVGEYSMDFHETIVTHTGMNQHTQFFEIPLGALIPVRLRNLLPACKNMGVTHISSSAYRLHPIEWNLGESAGYLAAFCLDKGYTPNDVYESAALTKEYQEILVNAGVQLHWLNSAKNTQKP